MNNRFVITIGREFGSGGRLIAKKLAEELNIKCYDKELLSLAAKDSGLCEDLFKTHDEKPNSSFLYSLVMDSYGMGFAANGYIDLPINHKIFLAQFESIKKLAKEENCIIVGRCADYALEDDKNVISIFISATYKDRLKRVMENNNLSEEKAKELIAKVDKQRASYYNYYSNKSWGNAQNYDLCISSSEVGIEGVIKIIKTYLEIKNFD